MEKNTYKTLFNLVQYALIVSLCSVFVLTGMWRTMAMFITSFFSFAMFLCWKQAGLPKKFDEREQKIADKAKNIAFTIILFIIIILGSFSMYFKLDIPLNIVLAVLLFVMFFAYKLSYMLFESRPIKD